MVKSGNSTIVRSAARALDVLEIVVQAEKAPTFTMIQKASGIPKSSLSYLMQELMQKRYVQYDPESKVYYPGLALLALSGLVALWVALASTPAGQTFLGLSGAVWDDLVNFLRGLVGLAPAPPSV